MLPGLEHFSYEERLDLFILEWRSLREEKKTSKSTFFPMVRMLSQDTKGLRRERCFGGDLRGNNSQKDIDLEGRWICFYAV